MSTLRDDEAETLEESRMLASAAKRKLQRLLGAQAALQRVQREGVAALRRESWLAAHCRCHSASCCRRPAF